MGENPRASARGYYASDSPCDLRDGRAHRIIREHPIWSSRVTATPTTSKHRIVILGGGFGGVFTARHLERRLRRHPNVEITLVSRDNYFIMTPLLFEAGSGVL